MDWLNHNKYNKWLIAILITMNVVLIITLWTKISPERKGIPFPGIPEIPPPPPIKLMQEELNLNKEQIDKFDLSQKNNFKKVAIILEKVSVLKEQLALEISADLPDTLKVRTIASRIGKLQSDIEILRFTHFNEMLSICNKQQKDKLRNIFKQIISHDMPMERPDGVPPPPPPPHAKRF